MAYTKFAIIFRYFGIPKVPFLLASICSAGLYLTACSLGGFSTDEKPNVISSCKKPSGSAWSPTVTGAGASNHDDAGISIAKSTTTGSASLLGYSQSFSLAGPSIVSVPVSIASDLGTSGSFTLFAEVTAMPAGVSGSAYPMLVSLVDPNGHEYINLNSTCTSSGLFTTGCGPSSPSAFPGSTLSARQSQWANQLMSASSATTNLFPTCNWNTGSPTCDFNAQSWFTSSKLPTGTYTAKFAVMSDTSTTVSAGKTTSIKVTTILKTDNDLGSNRGAVDLNVIIVGDQNVKDSRTAKGQQNLNALMTHVYNHYLTQNTSTTNLKIGAINAIEWDCNNGGDTYATIDIDNMGTLLAVGSSLVPASTETKAINLFLVSSIESGGAGTILGVAGGIVGAPVNGTVASGILFSSFDTLATMNPSCTGSGACSIAQQEPSFVDMGSTISHEMGHFLGLNHLSESDGTSHDSLPDTPICTNTSGGYLTVTSCRADTNVFAGTGNTCPSQCTGYSHSNNQNVAGTYCPTVQECQFNHVMWWTSKNQDYQGNGDGNLFSSKSAIKIGYSPYIR